MKVRILLHMPLYAFAIEENSKEKYELQPSRRERSIRAVCLKAIKQRSNYLTTFSAENKASHGFEIQQDRHSDCREKKESMLGLGFWVASNQLTIASFFDVCGSRSLVFTSEIGESIASKPDGQLRKLLAQAIARLLVHVGLGKQLGQ